MKDVEINIRNAVKDFYADPEFLEKLAAMAVQLAEGDQDFVPGCLLVQINLGDGYNSLKADMQKYFEVDNTQLERCDEGNRIFQALPDTAAFVLSNVAIAPVKLEACAPKFQEFFMRLRVLVDEDRGFAKATMFYGVALALFEWRDRQRSIPYNPDIHGPITLATTTPKKPK